MNVAELQRALRQLRLGGMAAVLETRLHQAQAEPMAPIDLISCLISDELTRRADRLLERRRTVSRTGRHRQKPSGAIHRPGRHPARLSRALPRGARPT